MEKWLKWGIGIVSGGLLLDAAVNASRLARFSKEFQLQTSARIQSISLTQVTFAVDIIFKNPTDATLRLKHPTVYLYNQNPTGKNPLPTPIQTSQIQGDIYTIKPNSETPIKPVYITLSLFSSTMLSAEWNIVKALINGHPIRLWVRALSQVNGTIPVVQVESFTFNDGHGKK